jgi:hypothetical protein
MRFSKLSRLADLSRLVTSSDKTDGRSVVPSIVVHSAGLESGGNGLGHIYVDGQDVSPNRRGYNVAALAPDGVVLWSDSFDTHADSTAAERLAEAIGSLKPGDIVAVAVADEASSKLTAEGFAALQSIGIEIDLRDKFRWGHAAIGMSGAVSGTALEAAGDLTPSVVHRGLGATEPEVSAAFAHFRFTPQS